MAQFQVGTFCWADPSLDFSKPTVTQRLQQPLCKQFSSVRSAFSSSKLPEEYASSGSSGYQPGGTFMASTGRWATRGTGKPLIDPTGMGRWSGLCYLGKRGKRLAILTAYRSPRQQHTGGFGFYDQQYSLLLSQGIAKPNVRKQFVTDLVLFVNHLQSEGYEVILSLDANETLGQDKTYGLAHLIDECTLTDLHLLGPEDPPATYKYGTDRRIDYMLGTAAVAAAVCRAGYNAYDNGVFSKHRGLFIDLDFTQLMGSVDLIAPTKARILRSDDQPSVDRYLEAFKRYADDHRLWARVKDLTTVASTMTPVQCKASFDAIDRDVTRAMLHAEKEARRPAGKYSWSPKLRAAGLLARYWLLRLREVENNLCLRSSLAPLLIRLQSLNIDLDDDSCADLLLLKDRSKKALKLLRKVRNDAYDYRAVHLLGTLERYHNLTFSDSEIKAGAQKANSSKIHRLTHLIAIEKMRQPFRSIHACMKLGNSSGLSKLFVPSGVKNRKVASKFCDEIGHVSQANLIAMAQSDKTSVEYATILDCEEIEAELTRYNREWFRQAKDTPFGHGIFFDLVGYDGMTEAASAIVNGDCIDYLGIPMRRELRVFLEECRRPASVKSISITITLDQFKKTVKGWKEATSTSPSGRHLGHYRTAILDDDVATMHTQLLNLPINYGFAPERWTHSVTPLIEKDAGRPFLTRLRVIHLFEADYNLFLKIIYGRRMVQNAEISEALNDQQHGSRPRRTTTDALFLARLEKDLIRQTKANSAHMDNDATGCYDRIVTSLGMIASRRLGMPASAIKCQAETLRMMKYSVKHVYGTSPHEYTGTDSAPLFGTGQGSGASPAIWLGLVVILLNSLDRMSAEDEIPSLDFADPWNELRVQWRVGAFVDDTNQGILDSQGVLSMEDLVEQIRRAGQLWETLLHISGGSLNLAKCSWTLQYWEWINGRPRLLPITTHDPPLLMTSGNSEEHHIIRQHSNTTELKGLGVHMNFMGTFAFHAATMRVKFDGIARRLRQSSLSPDLSRAFYNTFYLPSVRYSLSVTSMTHAELHRVQSLMTSSILNQLGFNRHYPHDVAFAPLAVFGCGLIDLRVEQGLLQIQSLLDYVGTQQRVGRVMLVSLRHLQVEAGVSFDLLRSPTPALSYLTDCWILSVRRFCAQFNISLRVRRNRIPLVSRVGDSLLMDKAITLGLSRQALVDLNLVRIFLCATSVSDIATADGKMFHPLTWKGRAIPDRNSRMTFARQEQPTSYQRGLWRRLLRSFLHPAATSSSPLLLTPLGPWIAESTMRWGAMLWNSNLYRSNPRIPRGNAANGRHISVHFPRSLDPTADTSRIYYDATPDWYTATIPTSATPADIEGCHIFTVTSSVSNLASIPAPAVSFKEWIHQLPPAEHRLISSHSFSECDAEQVLLQYLQIKCTLLIGTDGGKKHHNGAFSWIICSPGREQLVLNSGPVDGWHRCQSPLRSEAAAIASLTLYLDELTTFHQIDICCTFRLYVDSTSAISNVKTLRDLIPTRRLANHADLLSAMSSAHYVIEHFRITHVHSHQDTTTAFDELPLPEQLNTLCDRMATAQLQRQATDESVRSLRIPLTPRNLDVEVSYDQQVISSHYIARLRDSIGFARHRTYLQNKYKWPDNVWQSIAWDAFMTSARRSTALAHSTTRSKLVHNWLNLGSQRAKFGSGGTTSEIERRCPYCNKAEDFTHLLTCDDPRALKVRYEAMVPLRKALCASGQGGSALLRAIQAWTLTPLAHITLSAGDDILNLHGSVVTALESQQHIGWVHFFRGFVSLHWGHVHPATDTTLHADRWVLSEKTLTTMITAVQDYSMAIWRSRNELLHASNPDSLAIVHASLNAAISQLYSVSSTLSSILQSYFTLPLDDRLRQSPRQRKRWLRLARLATSHSSATGTRQQLLSTYYPHAPVPTGATSVTTRRDAERCPVVPPILLQPPITSYFGPPHT